MQRALPPTPSLQPRRIVPPGSTSLLDSKYESVSRREQRYFDELARCKKTLAAKETEITNLKTMVFEWKKKATDWERAHIQTQETLREREQFLAAQHTAELKALTKAHAKQTNEVLESVVHLQKENKALKGRCDSQVTSDTLAQQGEDDPCTAAEQAHRTASHAVLYGRKKMDAMLLSINDMVNAIEVELQQCHRASHTTDEAPLETEPPHHDSPADYESIDSIQNQSPTPPLSESSLSSSSEDISLDTKRHRHRSQAMDNLAKMVIPNFLRTSKSRSIYTAHTLRDVRPEQEEEPPKPCSSKTSSQRPLSMATSQLMQHYQLYHDRSKPRQVPPKRQSYVSNSPSRLSALPTSNVSTSEQWRMSGQCIPAPI